MAAIKTETYVTTKGPISKFFDTYKMNRILEVSQNLTNEMFMNCNCETKDWCNGLDQMSPNAWKLVWNHISLSCDFITK